MYKYYRQRLKPFFAAYMITGILTTAILASLNIMDLDLSVWAVLKTAFSSTLFLCAEFCFFALPFLFYLLILPAKKHGGKTDKAVTFILFTVSLYLLIFKSVAEYFFWEEFVSRFNFIAVDYLVYTQEVIENIYESYPIIKILSAAFVITCAFSLLFRKKLLPKKIETPLLKKRFYILAADAAFCAALSLVFTPELGDITQNRINNELAKSSAQGFVYAFFHNELEYKTYYPTLDKEESEAIIKEKINLVKHIKPAGQEIRPNVIIVLMESMSAKYLREDDANGAPLTPNLRRLAEQAVFFPNVYATGTRTVRGIEALTIAVPPLPGMSIVRRKGNENIHNIGSIFRGKGYKTQFIYGGVGFFDNMNYYFKNNGFEITDKTDFAKDEIRFANAWGVSDEDLFEKTIKEADKKYQSGERFFQFVLTTSNHRPYTYPDNAIDIPSGSGRNGAVKYADYAIGKFIEEASKKPWFENTVFLFAADHESGSAGKEELNPQQHRIPAVIYAPKLFKPEYRETEISQIDLLPTLLGLLNFDYESRFFGQDARSAEYKTRYFLINYQKTAYAEDGILTILKPVKKVDFYRVQGMEKIGNASKYQKYLKNAVSMFQKADCWKDFLKENKL